MGSQVMMMRLLLALFSLLSTVYCGELTVVNNPNSLRFGLAGNLRCTDLDDLMAACLGYTPAQSSSWKGLTVTSPFAFPKAAVVVEVHGGGATVSQGGYTYGLKEDSNIEEVFRKLKSVYGVRAQRHTLFKYMPIDSDIEDDHKHYAIPSATELDINQEPDATFLKEMAALIVGANAAKELSTTKHGGQDVIIFEVKALEMLVNTYGLGSPQVNEAIDILRTQLATVNRMMQDFYDNQVLVMTATVQSVPASRNKRSILDAPITPEDKVTINLASKFTADYPAIFNIILWLSIVLSLSILATAVATATMDPGRDSIIYRMTNPRMKKDN